MFWRAIALAPVVGLVAFLNFAQRENPVAAAQTLRGSTDPAPGQLVIQRKDGSVGDLCPLTKTVVEADVAGFGARVSVTQVFHNPTKETIEAIYTFPLPNSAAVDSMTMRIGDRVIEGVIKEREIAQRIYESARNAGQAAALLDQERPNVFTQSVANITPGAEVRIEIKYVQTLKFQDGTFEFNFPMVVGPRFLGNAKDPDKINPPVAPKGTRTGAGIEVTVNIDAGAPIKGVQSVLHEVTTERVDGRRYRVELKNRDEIPNRDFILRYAVAENAVTGAFVTHMEGDKGGFFGLAVVPPKHVESEDVASREFIFVMDQSGSQHGFPIAKSKELTIKLIDSLREGDTFNVIGFSNSTNNLWKAPRSRTAANVSEAKKFVQGLQAGGGTQIREGLIAGLQGAPDPERLRIVVFNTDGFVGDEKHILDTLQKMRGTARVFTFGIGNGVNRYLIDSMSAEGRGAAEYVTLEEDADAAASRFVKRLATPVLTDVSVKVDGVDVTDLEPAYLPDVFDQSPVYVFGRYLKPGKGKISIYGKQRGKPWAKTLDVDLPMASRHPQIMSMWARDRVDSLERENYTGQFSANGKDIRAAITDLALEFGIMSEYTSFVAVESRTVNIGGKQRTIRVPVELTQGVNYDTTVNQDSGIMRKSMVPMAAGRPNIGRGGGAASFGGGAGGGVSGLSAPHQQVAAGTSVVRFDPISVVKVDPLAKVAKSLRTATGTVEVQVWLADLSEATLNALKEAGVVKVDGKDEKLKLIFLTIDAAKLKKIAEIAAVQRVEPIG